MSNSETRLFRVEIERPTGPLDCYPCVAVDALHELIATLVSTAALTAGTVIRVYDYRRWNPGSEQGLIGALSLID